MHTKDATLSKWRCTGAAQHTSPTSVLQFCELTPSSATKYGQTTVEAPRTFYAYVSKTNTRMDE